MKINKFMSSTAAFPAKSAADVNAGDPVVDLSSDNLTPNLCLIIHHANQFIYLNHLI